MDYGKNSSLRAAWLGLRLLALGCFLGGVFWSTRCGVETSPRKQGREGAVGIHNGAVGKAARGLGRRHARNVGGVSGPGGGAPPAWNTTGIRPSHDTNLHLCNACARGDQRGNITIDFQPKVAEYGKTSLFPSRSMTVKIKFAGRKPNHRKGHNATQTDEFRSI